MKPVSVKNLSEKQMSVCVNLDMHIRFASCVAFALIVEMQTYPQHSAFPASWSIAELLE